MFTLDAQTRKKGGLVGKGVVYGSHIVFDEYPVAGVGTWKAIKATGAYTLSGQPTNGQTVTIGTKVYTFKTSITTADGDIKIGATLAETQANFVGAINGDQTLIGSSYGALTRPNAQVTASAFAANISTLSAFTPGTAGNSIATTATAGSFGGATLSGGLAESAADGLLIPASDQYNVSSYASISQSLWSSGIMSPSTNIAKRYQRFGSNYQQYEYATGTSKKKMITNQFDARIKNISKANIVSLLKENPTVVIGINYNQITRVSALDTNKFVIGNSSNQLQVIQINADGSLTVGTLFTHSQVVENFDCVDTGKIIGVRAVSASSLEYQYFTVSGTTISFSSANTFAVTGSLTSVRINVRKIATGKAALIYRNNTTTYGMRIVDVTGAMTISGSDTTITPTNVAATPAIVTYDTDKYAIIVGTNGSAVAQVYVCNVTGTAIAAGTVYTSTTLIQQDATGQYDYFSAVAINTTNIVFTAYGMSGSGTGRVVAMEQFSISGTTASFVKQFFFSATGTFNPQGVKILNVATDTYGLYYYSTTTLDSRYQANYVMIPFTVSGSTVTLSESFKDTQNATFDVTGITQSFTNPRLIEKVGAYFVMLSNNASTSGPIVVHTPATIELYNHETLISTVTTVYPFTENTVNFDGVANATINDEVAYIKVKNTHAQTHKIKFTGVLVEME